MEGKYLLLLIMLNMLKLRYIGEGSEWSDEKKTLILNFKL